MSPTAKQLRAAEAVVDRWWVDNVPVTEWLTRRLYQLGQDTDIHKPRAGRPRQLSIRTLLIGWLLVADTASGDDEMLLNRVHRKLTSIHHAPARRLGITNAAGRTITLRQVEYLWRRIINTVDGSPHFGGQQPRRPATRRTRSRTPTPRRRPLSSPSPECRR